jgi:hypothetical protein
MTDPYNPYQPPTTSPAAAPPQRDNISRLDISDKWKSRFRAIERAGGPDLPKFRDLPISDRRMVQFNWIAFFLGPFYYVAKGLWRQAAVYVLIAIACILALDAVDLRRLGRAVGYGFAAVYAIRANISYYRKLVLGKAPWV